MHFNNDQFLPDLIHHIKQKESESKNLTGLIKSPRISNKFFSSNILVVPDKKKQIISSKKPLHPTCDTSKSDDEHPNSIPKTQIPIFVLHPSGTHYIPMCIDSSLVSHAFNNSTLSQSTEQFQCHPVSIPVNFNTTSIIADSSELDIQNINVIGTRHQTSVRPS
jgi:hypothetical protein